VLSYRKFIHNVWEYLALNHPFSQVIENIRRQSCEGLALPFLANWLLGKASSLFQLFCLFRSSGRRCFKFSWMYIDAPVTFSGMLHSLLHHRLMAFGRDIWQLIL